MILRVRRDFMKIQETSRYRQLERLPYKSQTSPCLVIVTRYFCFVGFGGYVPPYLGLEFKEGHHSPGHTIRPYGFPTFYPSVNRWFLRRTHPFLSLSFLFPLECVIPTKRGWTIFSYTHSRKHHKDVLEIKTPESIVVVL